MAQFPSAVKDWHKDAGMLSSPLSHVLTPLALSALVPILISHSALPKDLVRTLPTAPNHNLSLRDKINPHL